MHQPPNTTNHTPQRHERQHSLAALRALIPDRRLEPGEALRIAELHANRLLELFGTADQLTADNLGALPRIRIEHTQLPTSGISYWNGRSWVIGINRDEPETRQRFTLLHEFKHIIDHGRTQHLYANNPRRAEQAADYFAGCALIPKRLLTSAWGHGIQQPADLAEAFAVSEPAIRVRLTQLGLNGEPEPASPAQTQRYQPYPGRPQRPRYYRSAIVNYTARAGKVATT